MYSHGTDLINVYSIVLEEQESILSDSGLDLLLKPGYNSRIVAIHKAQVYGRELSEVVDLFGDWRRDPVVDMNLASNIGWGWAEGSARCHDV